MIQLTDLQQSSEKLSEILIELRILRSNLDRQAGGRELSEAITLLETAGMWMNRAAFANEGDYDPSRLHKSEIK